jgi:hypothetical protein
MKDQLEIINPLAFPHWNDLVTGTEDYSFFHSENWARVLHETYGYRPVYFSRIEDGKLNTMIPVMEVKSMLTGTRGVSLPFTDHCDPIMPRGSSAEDALSCLMEHGRKVGWKYIELRGKRYFVQDTPVFSSYYYHTLPLSEDGQKIAAGFKRFNGKNIRRASSVGVDANMHTTLDSMKKFYVLHCKIRKLHGVPPQPFSFFRKLHEHVISKGLGNVILASYQGESIAGGVLFHFGDKVILKYSASDRKYQSLRANNLLIWSAIEWYAKSGYRTMSLGRTDPHAEGLRNFKNGWGADEETINYYHYDLSHEDFVTDNPGHRAIYNRILKIMPIPVLRLVGSLLYRHVG